MAAIRARSGLTGQPGFADPDSPIAIVWARALTGEVAPPLALAVLTEMDRLKDRLTPEAVPTVTTAMLDLGVNPGSYDQHHHPSHRSHPPHTSPSANPEHAA